MGRIGDLIGRRRTILYGSIIFFIGGAFQTFATGMPMMMVGRIIAGLGVGALSTIVPVYQSEISVCLCLPNPCSTSSTYIPLPSRHTTEGNWPASSSLETSRDTPPAFGSTMSVATLMAIIRGVYRCCVSASWADSSAWEVSSYANRPGESGKSYRFSPKLCLG